MNQQNLIMTALITVIASMALAAGGYYFVRPHLEPDLASPAAPPPPSAMDTAERNLLAVSMERIKGAGQEHFALRDVSRNPFIWPEDLLKLQLAQVEPESAEEAIVTVEEVRPATPTHELKMILVGELGRVAFIDRAMYAEGDVIGERRVDRITPLEVLLVGPDREEFRLTMAEAPRMITHGPPPSDARSALEPGRGAIPGEGDLAGQRDYLLQEMEISR